MNEVITPDDLAKMLKVSVRTLSRWHALGRGPKRHKVGSCIWYTVESINDWLNSKDALG